MGFNQRYAGKPRLIPAWAATVGAMKRDGTKALATCTSCGYTNRKIDLDAIIAKRGPNFSLFDYRPPCRTDGCAGRVLFMYGCPGGPMMPCTTT
jgi:hypothetical protein